MAVDALVVVAFDVADEAIAQKITDALAEFNFALQKFDFSVPPEHYAPTAGVLLLLFSQQVTQTDQWESVFMAFAKRQKPICIARLDDVELPTVLKSIEWVDFSFGFQVGINGLVYALQNPHIASLETTTVVSAHSAQQRINCGTLIALGIWIIGMILLALIF